MRIALLTSAQDWRGSGRSFGHIARGLAARGLSPHLISASPDVTTRFQAQGLPVTELPIRRTGFREVRALYRLLTELRTEAILTDKQRDLRLAALASLVRPVQLIHRYNVTEELPREDWRDRHAFSRAAAVVFLSSYSEERALRLFRWMKRAPRYRIANGFDVQRFCPAPDAGRRFRISWDIPDTARVVLSAAHFAPWKRHDLILAALARLPAREYPLVFLSCGEGPLFEEVRQRASTLGIRAVFPGVLDDDAMVAALNAADIVVHAAERETFGNAVGEAMACGKPVIAVAAGAVPEVLGGDGSTGRLVSPGDAVAMSQAIDELLENPTRSGALGQAARLRLMTEFSLDRMTAGYAAMFRAVGGKTVGR